MKHTDQEIRSYGGNAQPTFIEGRTITGYAIVFNQPSEVLYDAKSKKMFREIIRPEAINDDFIKRQDVKLNRNHDDDLLLARSRNGEGTLKLEIDAIGVRYTAELPNTTAGNDTLELVKRGDLFGSSFRFTYAHNGVRTSRMVDENMVMREVTALGGLYDVSVVADPAYMSTSVSVRSIEDDLAGIEPEPQVEPEPAPSAEPEPQPARAQLSDVQLERIELEFAELDNFNFE